MARLARVVVPGYPHHITQRGNRRQKVFFCDEDYRAYRDLMSHWCRFYGVDVWSYCLMPNHVHLLAVPCSEDGLARAIGEAHRRYTRLVNFREGWRGYLWQGRFSSFVVDGDYVLATARYIELNPVRAFLVERPEGYEWSSARVHMKGQGDVLAVSRYLLEMVNDWRIFLGGGLEERHAQVIRSHEHTGRPVGAVAFIEQLERVLNRPLRKNRPGPKKNVAH